ncbi:MAG: phenylalanine--tRNA ligase subunit alpha, partial [Castellaniella sp.]
MDSSLDELIAQARDRFAQAGDAATLENEKAVFLGKQGSLTALLKGLAALQGEEKRTRGAQINQAKQ